MISLFLLAAYRFPSTPLRAFGCSLFTVLWIPIDGVVVEVDLIVKIPQEIHAEQAMKWDGRAVILYDAYLNVFFFNWSCFDIAQIPDTGFNEFSSGDMKFKGTRGL